MSRTSGRICAGICAALAIVALILTITNTEEVYDSSFGVYIGADPENITDRDLAETIVIDAQYYTEKEIANLKKGGHTVYTYINIGSVESFRDYYKDFESITLGTYENWEDEKWVDVSDKRWQLFLSGKADELMNKGVDGFFVDNCDVYYNYMTEEIFEGVSDILKNLCGKNAYVMVNGGDEFAREYLKRHGNLNGILDGVNQESVYTAIDWDNNRFTVNTKEDREYFLEYLRLVMDAGKDAYAIEYITDPEIAQKAAELAAAKGYVVYIADSLALE